MSQNRPRQVAQYVSDDDGTAESYYTTSRAPAPPLPQRPTHSGQTRAGAYKEVVNRAPVPRRGYEYGQQDDYSSSYQDNSQYAYNRPPPPQQTQQRRPGPPQQPQPRTAGKPPAFNIDYKRPAAPRVPVTRAPPPPPPQQRMARPVAQPYRPPPTAYSGYDDADQDEGAGQPYAAGDEYAADEDDNPFEPDENYEQPEEEDAAMAQDDGEAEAYEDDQDVEEPDHSSTPHAQLNNMRDMQEEEHIQRSLFQRYGGVPPPKPKPKPKKKPASRRNQFIDDEAEESEDAADGWGGGDEYEEQQPEAAANGDDFDYGDDFVASDDDLSPGAKEKKRTAKEKQKRAAAEAAGKRKQQFDPHSANVMKGTSKIQELRRSGMRRTDQMLAEAAYDEDADDNYETEQVPRGRGGATKKQDAEDVEDHDEHGYDGDDAGHAATVSGVRGGKRTFEYSKSTPFRSGDQLVADGVVKGTVTYAHSDSKLSLSQTMITGKGQEIAWSQITPQNLLTCEFKKPKAFKLFVQLQKDEYYTLVPVQEKDMNTMFRNWSPETQRAYLKVPFQESSPISEGRMYFHKALWELYTSPFTGQQRKTNPKFAMWAPPSAGSIPGNFSGSVVDFILGARNGAPPPPRPAAAATARMQPLPKRASGAQPDSVQPPPKSKQPNGSSTNKKSALTLAHAFKDVAVRMMNDAESGDTLREVAAFRDKLCHIQRSNPPGSDVHVEIAKVISELSLVGMLIGCVAAMDDKVMSALCEHLGQPVDLFTSLDTPLPTKTNKRKHISDVQNDAKETEHSKKSRPEPKQPSIQEAFVQSIKPSIEKYHQEQEEQTKKASPLAVQSKQAGRSSKHRKVIRDDDSDDEKAQEGDTQPVVATAATKVKEEKSKPTTAVKESKAAPAVPASRVEADDDGEHELEHSEAKAAAPAPVSHSAAESTGVDEEEELERGGVKHEQTQGDAITPTPPAATSTPAKPAPAESSTEEANAVKVEPSAAPVRNHKSLISQFRAAAAVVKAPEATAPSVPQVRNNLMSQFREFVKKDVK